MRSAQQIWEAVLGELQLQVSKPNYNTWLKETTGISYQDDVLVVAVPSVFIAEWLANRLYSLIKRTLAGITGRGVEVQFLIQAPSQATRAAQPYQADGGSSAKLMEPPKTASFGSENNLDSIATNTTKESPNSFSLNPRYTLDNFVTGECNRLAHSAALEVVEGPGSIYNPLFIYGDTGVGKTHLLHAIAHAAKVKGLRVLYISAERFTNEFVTAIKAGKTEEFRLKFRNSDTFLLDDIHFLSGKAQTQECVFHTFNELYDNGCQIVATSDRPPRALSALQRKLRSRLESGLVVELQPPDWDTRLAILNAKAKRLKISIPPEVLQFLATQFPHNVRELEGALNKVSTYTKLSADKLDMRLAKKAVQEIVPSETRQAATATPRQTIDAVSEHYSVTAEALTGKRRDKKTALARQVAMYLLRQQNNYSLADIGRMLGDRDHTTILHGCEKIASELSTNHLLSKSIDAIRQELKARESTG